LVAGAHHNANLLNSSREDLLNQDAQGGFGRTVAIDEGLQRKRALRFSGGGDDSFFDFHNFELI
jgi:hypothetical protein